MLTFDDFNYDAYNKRILDLNVDLELSNLDKEGLTSESGNSFSSEDYDGESPHHLNSFEHLQSVKSDDLDLLEHGQNSPVGSDDIKMVRQKT